MLTGGCFCKAIRYEARGTPFHETNCHCSICRRTTGAPFVTWFSVRSSDFRITKGEPTLFNSTEKGVRSFCARCGTQLIFQHADFPDEIDVTTAASITPNWSRLAIIPARALGSDGSLRTDSRNTRKLVSRDKIVGEEVTIRPFTERDAAQVRQLFITVNRLLSPPDLRDAFEAYIERALTEEIDRIPAYYGERNGGFWVAVKGDELVGTFGLERASDDAMELRRMYVDPLARRRGIARQMLRLAEDECRRRNVSWLELSTAEIQQEALALYRNAGYRLVREETVEALSNKTVGSGIRRYYLEKILR